MRVVYPAGCLALFFAWIGLLPAASLYQIRDLGSLDGGTSAGMAINEAGHVTGYSSIGGLTHAFKWDGTQLIDLGAPGKNSTGNAINAAGNVAGTTDGPSGFSQAFLHKNGAMQLLNTPAGFPATGFGLNNANAVVGTHYQLLPESSAFMWNNGVLTNLTGRYAMARAINNNGHVVGASGLGGTHAFFWNGTTMVNIGAFGDKGFSDAYAVNDFGQVTGEALFATGTNAFLWDGMNLRDLGRIGFKSLGKAINSSAWVVGRTAITSTEYRAFVHDGTAMVDLNTLLTDATGWILQEANGINNAGQIVGTGIHNGKQRAFLLTPLTPPPGPFCVTSGAGLARGAAVCGSTPPAGGSSTVGSAGGSNTNTGGGTTTCVPGAPNRGGVPCTPTPIDNPSTTMPTPGGATNTGGCIPSVGPNRSGVSCTGGTTTPTQPANPTTPSNGCAVGMPNRSGVCQP